MESSQVERWMPVVGHEKFYEVSDFGRVRSLSRTYKTARGNDRVYPGRLIKLSPEKRSGYLTMALFAENKSCPARVHNLVLEAFVSPRPSGAVARHLNGNPADNRPDNLAWGTPLENAREAQAHGTWCRGEKHGAAKLTNLQARAIYELRGRMSRPAIGEVFGVSASTVQGIHEGKTWRVVRA